MPAARMPAARGPHNSDSIMSHTLPPVGWIGTPWLSYLVQIHCTLWECVTLCGLLFLYTSLMLLYLDLVLRDATCTLCELAITFCAFIITLCVFVICLCWFNNTALICSLCFVHFLILLWTLHFVKSLYSSGKSRSRHVTTLNVMWVCHYGKWVCHYVIWVWYYVMWLCHYVILVWY